MLAGCTVSPSLSSLSECEKHAISQCASVLRLPPSVVDVINIISLEGILEQGKRVVITTQCPLQVHASVGGWAFA